MKGFNQVIIMGNATADVECKVGGSGSEYASFSVAVNDSYKDKSGQKVESVTYINVVAFGATAKIAGSYVKKGTPVFIRGSLIVSKSQTQSGENRTYTNVKIQELSLLPSGSRKAQGRDANESLDGYFPKDNTQGYGSGEYRNRPYPGGSAPSVPESLSEEFMGIDPGLDTRFDFGDNVKSNPQPWE